MTYVWSSISSLEGECRVASPSRQLWQFPHTFIVIVVITGNTYRCQHHSPTFNVRIYLQNPSKKSTYVHSFTNLLTHTHTYIYIYMYISHIQYIYYIIYNIIIYLDKHFQVYSSNSCQKGPCEPCRKPQFLSGNVRDGMTIFWQAGPHSAMTSGGWKTMVFPIKKVPLRPLNQPSQIKL